MTSENDRAAQIAALNDAFRIGARPELGRIMITAGAREAVAAWPLGEIGLFGQVQAFRSFTEDNDPYGEHDFGAFKHVGEKFFWKLDYYAKGSAFSEGSEAPEDATKTDRVLTIMLAKEY